MTQSNYGVVATQSNYGVVVATQLN